jgi:hypothetical protein
MLNIQQLLSETLLITDAATDPVSEAEEDNLFLRTQSERAHY